MNKAKPSGEFRFSQTVYDHLLRAYPRVHRAEYGAAMAQLFHDQCRDAWHQSRNWGLLKLWVRTVPDLVSTSILERIAALKERKTMTEKLANLFGFRATPVSMFFRVFALVFLLVFITSVAITFILPESYASTARIKLDMVQENRPSYDPYFVQTTFEIIQSQLVLKPVIDKLNLNIEWGKKHFNGEALKTAETMELLKQRLQLAPVKNTKLIAITAYSDDRNEAAQIANAVAECYRDYLRNSRAEAVDKGLEVLRQQYGDQERQIQETQTDLDALHQRFGIVDNVDGLGVQLANSKRSIHELEEELSGLQTFSNDKRRNILPSIVPDTTLSELLSKLDDAEQKYATLTNDYALNNVQVTRVTSLIDVLNKQIDDRAAGLMGGLESHLAGLKAASDALVAEVQRSKPTPENQLYWATKRNLDQLVEAHKMLYAKIEEQKLDSGLPNDSMAVIVDPAEPGFALVKPNKTLNIILGAILGIFLATSAGAVFAFLSLILGRRIRNTVAAT